MAKILITRKLGQNDWLKLQFDNGPHQLNGVSFVSFEAVSFHEIPKAEWLFFYSRNGVKYFLEQLIDLSILNEYKLATIGVGSADELIKRGFKVNFIGKGQPKEVAADFLSSELPKSVLFPRALNSKNSIRDLINGYCNCYDVIVYSNTLKPQVLDFESDIIVFTSPMNVEGYFQNNVGSKDTVIISIGPSTTESLTSLKIGGIHELDSPDDVTLFEMLMKNL